MTLPIFCEECGKLYHISKEKLRNIKGTVAKTKCRNCGFVIMVNKSEADAPDRLEELENLEEIVEDDDTGPEPSINSAAVHKAIPTPSEPSPFPAVGVHSQAKRKGLGLRAKMIVLFLIVPLAIMATSGYFSQRQINTMVFTLVNQSAEMITTLAEQNVADVSKSVARQVQLYFESNPGITRERIAENRELISLAIQKVGATGATYLYATGPFTVLASAAGNLNGKPLSETMRRELGADWSRLENLIAPLDDGKNVPRQGYFLWKGQDGTTSEQYAVMTPISGTGYGIAAAADTREFTKPLDKMKKYAGQQAVRTKNTNFAITVATLIIIGAIVTIYGQTLVNRIKTLTDAADRISVGELDAEITITSQDEFGNLADAISRMQESLRQSIMRLRRRR